MLIMNIEPHQKFCSSQPLSTLPTAAPMPAKPAQIAIARRRSAGGNTWASTDSVAGMTRAAPMPMVAREAIKRADEPEKAATAEAAPKMASPMLRASRRP